MTATLLRVWLWLMPIAMLITAIVFGAIAAADGRWALLAAMVIAGLFACGLLILHYWLLYRFGRDGS